MHFVSSIKHIQSHGYYIYHMIHYNIQRCALNYIQNTENTEIKMVVCIFILRCM